MYIYIYVYTYVRVHARVRVPFGVCVPVYMYVYVSMYMALWYVMNSADTYFLDMVWGLRDLAGHLALQPGGSLRQPAVEELTEVETVVAGEHNFDTLQSMTVLFLALSLYMSSVQNLCWLMILVDCTTQYVGDYNNLIEGSL